MEQPLATKVVDSMSTNALPLGNDTREWSFVREYVNSPDTVADEVVEQPLTMEFEASSNTASDDTTERLLTSKFLNSPSQETLNDIISDFINTTGNKALKTVPC